MKLIHPGMTLAFEEKDWAGAVALLASAFPNELLSAELERGCSFVFQLCAAPTLEIQIRWKQKLYYWCSSAYGYTMSSADYPVTYENPMVIIYSRNSL